ncbi:acyl-ACP--UDP-N-acetylglucosamine O-acyltransferase [Commensalibacter oyaizuii]|uniref:Acyl-ACP--UDP-N-acetylglucosamine O-acyltransferase n=1 Tax=Commensalibacter oyaizuii TaxID=3043873 RepID=A0ABT6PYZ7_9PROT|nr:acyl-ACP--UDP-N-acetylglucosamine O-acyltransferase [Commensalibacter sp. TBRC 16381]MDI2090076.1 acyl-ACP--UDP-N-acetylglucosamine O-acyltransferase [Commensalibacter sp. TBRC 16381]
MEETLADSSQVNTDSMGNHIHPSAIVSPGAQLGQGIVIGPWCMVGPNVVIEDGVRLVANVVVDGHTTLGKDSVYYPFVTIGLAPQDLKYKGEPTRCVIGSRTIVREQVTIHRGTEIGSGITYIGSDCLVMVNAHIAHDCHLGDRVIIVNNVVLGGHVHIDDDARIMGSAAIHQFVRIGRAALVGGVTGVESDVIPYGSVVGNRARLVGMHWVWLKRNGVKNTELHILRNVYRTLFPRDELSNNVFEDRLLIVKEKFGQNDRVQEIIKFIEQPSRRGLVKIGRSIASSEGEE